jgi:mannitol/fructose-specific phosphotransferase system IIA component (Ntr-type)
MRLDELVVPDAIEPCLLATARESAIRSMVEGLRDGGQLPAADLEDVVRSVLERESLAPTGIGRGVAIPHTKHASVARVVAAVAVSPSGVPFESLDGEPVSVFVLILSPPDQTRAHLRALETVSRWLRDDDFVGALRAARTREEILALIEQAPALEMRSRTAEETRERGVRLADRFVAGPEPCFPAGAHG